MKNYKLTIAYDGSNYYGYQRQIGQITIQAMLERALRRLFKQQIKINGSGRTDTGVHALGQVVNFTSDTYIPANNLDFALNNLLPDDIIVLTAEEVDLSFHARYSATGKHYKYKILRTETPTPFEQRYCWQVASALDLVAMQNATNLLTGIHDFTSFRSTGSLQGSPVRNIYRADWSTRPFENSFLDYNVVASSQMYELDIYGNGFLYHMVRNIVGLIVNVGMGKMSVGEFEQIFLNQARTSKSVVAPAQGLYLCKVEY